MLTFTETSILSNSRFLSGAEVIEGSVYVYFDLLLPSLSITSFSPKAKSGLSYKLAKPKN